MSPSGEEDDIPVRQPKRKRLSARVAAAAAPQVAPEAAAALFPPTPAPPYHPAAGDAAASAPASASLLRTRARACTACRVPTPHTRAAAGGSGAAGFLGLTHAARELDRSDLPQQLQRASSAGYAFDSMALEGA